MSQTLGCNYCFKTLNPNDKDVSLQKFISCQECSATYHAICWDHIRKCSNCNSSHVQEKKVINVAPMAPQTKKRAMTIKPSAIFYLWREEFIEYDSQKPTINQYAQKIDKLVQSILIAAAIVAVGAFVGIYIPPFFELMQSGITDWRSVTQLISNSSLLTEQTVTLNSLAAIITGFIFYQPFHKEHSARQHPVSTGVWVLAGGIALLLGNIYILELSLPELFNPQTFHDDYLQLVGAQFATIFLLILLIPLYQRFAPTLPTLNVIRSPVVREIYGWLRLGLVTFVMIYTATHLTTQVLSSSRETVFLWEISTNQLHFEIRPLLIAAILGALTSALFFYRSPPFRKIKLSYGTLRLVSLVLCFGIVLYIFQALPAELRNSLIIDTATASVIGVLLIPIQRVLS